MALKTQKPRLDVIIPVKNRTTVWHCVSVLLSQLSLVKTVQLGTLWLCDGGSDDKDCLSQLVAAAELKSVTLLRCPHNGFNKGWLLNQGLAISTAQLVVVSDVDIVWNATALTALTLAVLNDEQALCSVDKVEESEPDKTAAISRQRYAYRISQADGATSVEVFVATSSADDRPGCGLLCAQRSAFERMGGYRDCFVGWGWEDQDLLMRAQLLGYRVVAVGQVMHLTHGEASRNVLTTRGQPEMSRDRNILRCLQGLEKGQLRGDWPAPYPAAVAREAPDSIVVSYPKALCS